MPRPALSLTWLLAAAALAGAPPAAAKRTIVAAAAPLVEVSSPAPDARFAPGETLRIAWRALPELALHPGVEEWEAFLSLDGGRSYGARLTPHLAVAQRSFVVRLPAVPAARARLLLRFGDERRELEMELPWTFEIGRARPALEPVPPLPAAGLGEAARAGERGVGEWVEGDRAGRDVRRIVAAREGSSLDGARLLRWSDLAPFPVERGGAGLAPVVRSTHPAAGPPLEQRRPAPNDRAAAALEPRRRTCRQNE